MRKRSLFVIFVTVLMLFATACGGNKLTVENSEEDININKEESVDEDKAEDESGLVDEEDSADGDNSIEKETSGDNEESDEEVDAGGAKTSSGRYVKGIYEGTSWISEWLGMRYDQPKGFLLASDEELDAMIQAGSNLAFEDNADAVLDYMKLTTVYELMVMAPVGIPTFSLAVERSPLSADEYMDFLSQQFSMVSAVSIDFKGYEGTEDIGGIEFDKYAIESEYNGVAMNQIYYITEKDSRLVYIIVTYLDDNLDALDTMMSGFSAL